MNASSTHRERETERELEMTTLSNCAERRKPKQFENQFTINLLSLSLLLLVLVLLLSSSYCTGYFFVQTTPRGLAGRAAHKLHYINNIILHYINLRNTIYIIIYIYTLHN